MEALNLWVSLLVVPLSISLIGIIEADVANDVSPLWQLHECPHTVTSSLTHCTLGVQWL